MGAGGCGWRAGLGVGLELGQPSCRGGWFWGFNAHNDKQFLFISFPHQKKVQHTNYRHQNRHQTDGQHHDIIDRHSHGDMLRHAKLLNPEPRLPCRNNAQDADPKESIG